MVQPWYLKPGSTLPGPENVTTIHADDSAAEMLRQNGMLQVGGPGHDETAAPVLTSGEYRLHSIATCRATLPFAHDGNFLEAMGLCSHLLGEQPLKHPG